MDKDIIAVVCIMICAVLSTVLIMVYGSTIMAMNLYADKTFQCTEDQGATYIATVSSDFWDTFWYLEFDERGFRFKSKDGKIYSCRGSVEEILDYENE